MLAHVAGYVRGRDDVQAQWDAASAAAAEQLAATEAEYRAREQQLQRDTQGISDDLHAQLDQTRTDYILAVDAVRADRNRLRQQFRGCSADLPGTTGIADTAGGDDDTGAGGLSETDVRVALRLAADANRVAAKLAACQAYVNSVQAKF